MTEETTQPQQDVFSYITSEINNYQTQPITIIEGYDWSLYRHVRLTVLYKNSQFSQGNSESERDRKPFRNILRPILNLQHRAEGFDVKDIVLYVNDRKNYYKSFLTRKFHENWARENDLDTFIDKLCETYIDFGGTLVKKVKNSIPEVVPWESIAFCDQTDVLNGPICIKHFLSPNQLKKKEKVGWGDEKNGATISIDDLLVMARPARKSDDAKKESKTPGKYIEVYELHGVFPESWLRDDEESREPIQQLQIVGYYQKPEGEKAGVILYRGKEDSPFDFESRDEIFGRGLGMGGGEELFESQVWTNYDMIRIRDLLDAGSKVIVQTADPKIAMRQNLRDVDNLQIIEHEAGKPLTQVPITPTNLRYFEKAVQDWEEHARMTGAAQEAIMGDQPHAGTPFKSVEFQAAESHSLHEYRKGKLAIFLDRIYRKWIIPMITSSMNMGSEFLSELSLEDMEEIVDNVVNNEVDRINTERVLNGENILPIEELKEKVKTSFKKNNKKFLKILQGEMKDAPMSVKLNIAGKQQYLGKITDKLVNVFRQVIANPEVLKQPPMAKLFNEILEKSGLSPIDFSGLKDFAPALPTGAPMGAPAGRPESNLAEIVK